MKKMLTGGLLVLALSLGSPAFAASTVDPAPICDHKNTGQPPAPCTVDELWGMYQTEVGYLSQAIDRLADLQAQVTALQVKVALKNATIHRLRHKVRHLRHELRTAQH